MRRQTNMAVRLLTDSAMAGVFIALMTYRYTGITAHEFLGLTLILLIFVHIFLNWRWYATISKGVYTLLRSVRAAVNILLLSAFLSMLASSFMVSKVVFAFVGIKGELLARNLHLFFTHWSFILAGIHLGLYWQRFTGEIWQFLRIESVNPRMTNISRSLVVLFSLYGVYAFFQKELAHRLIMFSAFSFWSPDDNILFLVVDYLSIFCLCASISLYAMNFLHRQNKTIRESE